MARSHRLRAGNETNNFLDRYDHMLSLTLGLGGNEMARVAADVYVINCIPVHTDSFLELL